MLVVAPVLLLLLTLLTFFFFFYTVAASVSWVPRAMNMLVFSCMALTSNTDVVSFSFMIAGSFFCKPPTSDGSTISSCYIVG
jgi:hypothetical protein